MCGQDETQENARRVALAPHFAVLPDGKVCDDQGDQRHDNVDALMLSFAGALLTTSIHRNVQMVILPPCRRFNVRYQRDSAGHTWA